MEGRLYFGGAFNPPHLAHTRCTAAAAIACGLSDVTLVPTGRPVLKDLADVAPAADRLAMTRLAAADAMAASPSIAFAVDAIEIDRPGLTYTIDTVEALTARGERVRWLVGGDQLLNLHRWHRFEDLLRVVRFVVMARPGYVIDWDAVHPAVRVLRAEVVTVPQMEVSATEVRRRLRAGEPTDGMLAPGVAAYVRAHGLYGTRREGLAPSAADQ